MSNQDQPLVITCDAYWAFTNKPNQLSGKYQVDLCNLSDKAVEALEERGISVKNKEAQGSYITPVSKRNIRAYNTAGDELSGVDIGNGSKARAVIGTYDWNFNGKQGRSPSLVKFIIDDLIVFEGGEGSGGSYDLDEAI
jgi:hypothetical protein